MPDPGSAVGPKVAWIALDGTPIAEEQWGFESPAQVVLNRLDDWGEHPAPVLETVVAALALPGTRYDYHSAFGRLAGAAGMDPDWVERALLADVQLVLSDPRSAVTSPWSASIDSSHSASVPFGRLIQLYVREGFLVDALRVEAVLETLPEKFREDYLVRLPARVCDALRALQK